MRLRHVENLLGNNQQAGTVGCPGECAERISWPQVGYSEAEDGDENRMAGVAWRLEFMRLPGLEASINYGQEQYGNDMVTVLS